MEIYVTILAKQHYHPKIKSSLEIMLIIWVDCNVHSWYHTVPAFRCYLVLTPSGPKRYTYPGVYQKCQMLAVGSVSGFPSRRSCESAAGKMHTLPKTTRPPSPAQIISLCDFIFWDDRAKDILLTQCGLYFHWLPWNLVNGLLLSLLGTLSNTAFPGLFPTFPCWTLSQG